MILEEFRERLADLPAFAHTPVTVSSDNGLSSVEGVDYGSPGIVIQIGALSESEWAQVQREAHHAKAERLRACSAALLALIDRSLKGKPLSVPQLRALRQAVITGDPLPGELVRGQTRKTKRAQTVSTDDGVVGAM